MPHPAIRSARRAAPGAARAARHGRRFYGREDELASFRAALAQNASLAVLYVHGIGGVGKSALLREYRSVAEQVGITAVCLDGRLVDPSPGGFLIALADALGLPRDESPLSRINGLDRIVLLVDGCELLAPLEAWLREALLPTLPARAVIVLAGRNPPAPEWIIDLAWAPSVCVLPLRNLRPDESRALLAARGVPVARHEELLAFTHGHPLARVLVADAASAPDAGASFEPERAPHVVGALLQRIVSGAPGPAHRRALELCAHVRVSNEPLLAATIDGADPHELFEWLRGRSFIEAGPEGLFPHDVAREALEADFRWRDPDGYRELHEQVFAWLGDRLRRSAGRARQRAFFDNAAGGEPTVVHLEKFLRHAVERLAATERGGKVHRALWHTYIEPAGSQERVAERLGLPFNTYRYHLAHGTDRVAAWLWEQELHGGSGTLASVHRA